MQQHPSAGLPQIIYDQIFMQQEHVNYCNMLLALSACSTRLVRSHENLHYIIQVSTTQILVFNDGGCGLFKLQGHQPSKIPHLQLGMRSK